MNKKLHEFLHKNVNWYVLLIILIGIIIRAIDFGNTPCGFNQDEAFAGYEAFSLLNYGVDSAGYHNPCYFVSWGSGMNVLESYLAIPFMKLFGCSVITLRLPQLLFSCISLPVFYLLLKRIFSYKTAVIGLSLLVISPWHIMLSRWGLESNLAPAFLLIGFYFFIRGITDNKYFIFSAIIYGISLYSYSITWIVVPLTILACGLYIIFAKQQVDLRYILPSAAILYVFALPLILFLFVNKGLIPEITTKFFSVPKLLSMRSSEISIDNFFLPQSYYNLFKILLNQNDGLIWNSTADFGMFYKISTPFIIVGAVKITTTAVKNIRAKIFSYQVIVLIGMMCSVLSCLLIENLNINKSNSLHFYTLILLTIGVKEILFVFKRHSVVAKAIVCSYAISFMFFSSFYFSNYNEQISQRFRYGLEDAIQYVKAHDFEDIYVDSSIYYPQVLFFDQTPNDIYRNTVECSNYPSAFLDVEKFGKYIFGIDYDCLEPDKVYIIKKDKKQNFIEEGYRIVSFENYAVAYKSE